MNNKQLIFCFLIIFLFNSCRDKRLEEKGFEVAKISDEDDDVNDGINKDSIKLITQPSNVVMTGISNIRLSTLYKVNFNKRNKTSFIGSNNFYYRYEEADFSKKNNWNNNLMPGFEAVYGYNMVNVSHYNINENKQKNFFIKPVLIKTLYYPTQSNDTLNGLPIKRNYFMVSAYDEDSNKDGFINLKDTRKLYLFDINGENQKALVPKDYSVIKSEYDSENDYMYVFAKLTTQENNPSSDILPIHIFWIDLKDPTKTGRLY